jgi:uncharacterized protein YceH (UPF0502 family)
MDVDPDNRSVADAALLHRGAQHAADLLARCEADRTDLESKAHRLPAAAADEGGAIVNRLIEAAGRVKRVLAGE